MPSLQQSRFGADSNAYQLSTVLSGSLNFAGSFSSPVPGAAISAPAVAYVIADRKTTSPEIASLSQVAPRLYRRLLWWWHLQVFRGIVQRLVRRRVHRKLPPVSASWLGRQP